MKFENIILMYGHSYNSNGELYFYKRESMISNIYNYLIILDGFNMIGRQVLFF